MNVGNNKLLPQKHYVVSNDMREIKTISAIKFLEFCFNIFYSKIFLSMNKNVSYL